MNERIPAEVFLPGDFIKEELECREWNQGDLADILGKSGRFVSDIINGKHSITATTAHSLAEAFGTSPEYWMNLESAYQLGKVEKASTSVGRRANLYSMAPIKEMIKRGWIENSTSLAVLEKNTLDFFEINSLQEEPLPPAYAARKSTSYNALTAAQMAWIYRVKHLARLLHAEKFSRSRLDQAIQGLRLLWANPEEARQVPKVLADSGIRFLVVEALPGSKIDGACLWLEDQSPVIATSLRYDRIDYFWHTVMHELGHVKNEDEFSLDSDILANATDDEKTTDRPPGEIEADRFAVENLVPQDELEDFITRLSPLYPKLRLTGFASLMNVHPGIVVGQLQHRGEISYSRNRELLTKIRSIVTSTALTDGFGQELPAYP